MVESDQKVLKVGIGGLGTVGLPVAQWLDEGPEEGLVLVAVSAGNRERASQRMKGFRNPVPVVELTELADLCDVVVECAPPGHFLDIAEATLKAGRILMPLSVTSLLNHMDLIDLARQTGGRILVPTGAILGLDAVRAAALGKVNSVTMITRKPPAGLKKAPFVIEQGFDLEDLEEAVLLYEGPVSDAAAKFPANVNVAVALALAGIGPDLTQYQVWADPAVTRNTHVIKVDADTVSFEMTTAVVPTEENPATGQVVRLSVIETLRGLVTPFKVGT
ncbi:MAG: aspartate dehydrogenase [Alphaproteobacteria bacterium]|jgi:aspartate dehydrogenase|nr:aspartate dehydrogenase [Alphaproteobacteria bacterium]MBT7943889.1 aspartate dehydrogenase [Alphaproteobacteria bacterium]